MDAHHYLRAVYRLTDDPDERVGTGALADAVERSPAATTGAVQRLEARGLLDYEPYQGVRLTADGRERAAALHEEYETLRRFLDDVLRIDDPDEEAAALLGVVSADVLQRLDETVIPPPDD